ncbi:hypothetical protein QU481_21730 [Crenobacter sp. SG2303]|uniref:Secreted protein n=1 Tax=Crenobacter oryzisoli TaxID=3056844 RepID=A0ABT7XUP0_9NEIS|nr:hypothetical protein [Crenobacter sp. SG2303]MDN0077450.1 hypothetical protein [Crenobacter sp. SG2303]
MSILRRLVLLSLLTASPVWAASYSDPRLPIRINVPSGWKVRPVLVEGERRIKVVPPKADERERAAIEVLISQRRFAPGESLERTARHLRRPDDDREAASMIKLNSKAGRLDADYRVGRFVTSDLWILQRVRLVQQRIDKRQLIEARCAANASEYKTYRHALETICQSLMVVKR